MSKGAKNPISSLTKGKDESVSEFVCCCISCWLLSVGVCLLFDAQFEFETGLITVLWQTAVSMVIVALMSRKWWIPLIYIGTMGLIVGVFAIVGNGTQNPVTDAWGFINWWIDLMPADSPWYSEESIFLVHTLINIGIPIGFFALMRITRKSWIIALLSLAIIVWVYAFGYTEYDILTVVFYFVGVFSLVAGEKFRGHKLFKRKSIFSVLGNRWVVTVISIVICFAISFSAVLVLDNDKELDIRNRFSSDIAADVQSFSGFYTAEQQALRITLYELGLQSNTEYIGGGLYNIKPKMLATTDLETPTLVKMTSFDKYNGRKWTGSFENTYRFNGPWVDKEIGYLSGNVIEDDFDFASLESLYRVQNVKVTLNSDAFFLPSVGQTLYYTENTPSKNPTLFDNRGQILSYYGQKQGYSYTLNSLTYLTKTKLTPEVRRTVKQIVTEEDPYYTEELKEIYTKQETKLTDRAVKAMEQLDIDKSDPYDVAYKISRYFSTANGFTYTKNPPVFSETDDIVDKLFLTKSGHCVYYSTAMITMLRYLDIPARLAAGYKTMGNRAGKQIVNRSNPYCWVECYLPNLGWVAFDPSPGQAIILVQSDKNSSSDKDKSKEPELQKPDKDQTPEEPEPFEPSAKPFPIGWIIFACVLVLAIIYLFARTVFVSKLYEIDAVGRRFVSPEKQAEFYWRDILRLFRCVGHKRQKGETARELGQRVCDELIYRNEDTVMKAISVIEALRYGEITPQSEDIAVLYDAISALEMEAKWKMKPLPYFLIRKMFRPAL